MKYEKYKVKSALKYINKTAFTDLSLLISSTNDFNTNVKIIESYLLQMLNINSKSYNFNRMSHIINIIRSDMGNVNIPELASEVCLSRKQFERIFMEYIGISTKQYLKTIRLQASIFSKSKNTNISLTDLAYKHGYYDQSHFINDFKTMTGLTPKHFFEEKPISDFFE